ncbi:putative bifunctional diguanylate cyclase/phosphodiesterase [Thiomicrorhabdus arctica]|uniref:putative bifunctional diguanylate cyclase/phosphodiesterase n=1 Tax=Thiomicrorhabdus arctica TaxID=131540 RepID=UPI00037765C0|nr:GGDEF domain-containing phosphodiesterase [Thiomicrorhabdus arctica]
MQEILRLKRITSLTAYSVSAVILFVIPAIYFITAFNQKVEWLTYMVESLSSRLSELIYTAPESWQYRSHNIEYILNHTAYHSTPLYYQVQDSSGAEVLQTTVIQSHSWLYSVSAELSDGINAVGTLSISFDLVPLIMQTLLVALVALIAASALYYVLRMLPFAHLEKAMLQLSDSRKLLREEVEAKKLALNAQQLISEQMEYQSLHDSLTKLPNRKLFNQKVRALLHYDQRSKAQRFCVMLLDLDRFKEINDSLGHQLGDLVLIELANRLTEVLPEAELIARLGGDEYAILTRRCDAGCLNDQLERIFSALKFHFNLEGFHLSVDASVGVSCYPKHGSTREKLVRHADIAMYHAKTHGLSWSIYEQKFDVSTPDRLRLVSDLRFALENQQLTLHYQPKLCLKTHKIVSMEALARWQHPEFGMIAPDVFIPMAEQSNLINSLTTWLIETALKQLKEWHGTYSESMSMAVNISAKNLQDATLSTGLIQKLTEYDIAPEFLTLEITETMMMQDPEQSRLVIQGLSDLGIKIAIDDFGTGYSSLSYLKRLAVDQVKIDRSFTMNMLTEPDDKIIVESTINLAHSLGMEVVAEGIEVAEVITLLQALGCEYGQGYYICRPMKGDSIFDWLQQFDLQENPSP